MSCLGVLAVSMHVALPGEWNEVHPGVRCERDGWIGGGYYNSESKASLFVGREVGPCDVGLVTGYSAAAVVPMVKCSYELDGGAEVFASPAVTVDGDFGVVVGLQFNIGE